MNLVNRIARDFLTQYLNEDDFLTDTANSVPYYQGEIIEKMKVISTYEVSTIFEASGLSMLNATTALSGGIYLTLPFTTWADEGFVLGDTIKIEANSLSTIETVLSIAGSKMLISDTGFFAALGVVSGNRSDYVVKVTTVPTSLIFKFGILPNSVIPNNFNSRLDGQEQVYTSGAITGVLSPLNYLATNSSNLGGVEAIYDGVTSDYIFTFTVEHEFRTPHYLEEWLDEYQSGLPPSDFEGSNSWRYISDLNFGVNVNNPNDGKIFTDPFELGSIGFLGQNFNAGVVNYELVSLVFDVGGDVVDAPDITQTTNITAQIRNLTGSFGGTVKGYAYHTKLTPEAEYSLNDNSFDTNFVLDQLSNLTTMGPVSSTIIKNLNVVINADPTLIDITFELEYSASQQIKFSDGQYISLDLIVADPTLSAVLSDRMKIKLAVVQLEINMDVDGLIVSFNPAFNNPGSLVTRTNGDLWINRAVDFNFDFELNKDLAYNFVELRSIKYQLVAYNVADDQFFLMDAFSLPFGLPPVLLVGGTTYQILNLDTTRVLSVPSADPLREVQLTMEAPAIYEATQTVTGKVGFIIPWQEWIINSGVPYDFYNGLLPPNFNRNQRTSNYSDELGYDIYCFLNLEIQSSETIDNETLAPTTNYILNSSVYDVADFDVDVAAEGWTKTFEIFNESNVPIPFFDRSQINRLEVTLASPIAGAIVLQGFLGELVLEETDNTGSHSRLHSALDWREELNPLKPIGVLTGIKVEQDILGSTIKLSCYVEGPLLTENNQNIYFHTYR